jgi:hypothetical protein
VPVSMTALRSRVAGDANDVDLDTHVLDTFFTGDVVVALVRGDEGAARAQARRFSREQSKASSCRDERSAQRPAAAAAAKPAPAAAKGMPPPSRGVVALASRWRTGRGAARRAAVDRQCRRASRVSRDSPRALPRRCRCAKDAAAIARRRARGGAVPRGCGTNGVSVGIRAAAVPHAVGNVCVLLVRGSTPYHSDSSSPRHDTCAREYALFFTYVPSVVERGPASSRAQCAGPSGGSRCAPRERASARHRASTRSAMGCDEYVGRRSTSPSGLTSS